MAWYFVKHGENFFALKMLDITVIKKKGKTLYAVHEIYENVQYEGVSKNFRTGRLERELQILQLSATRRSYIAIL
jgi:hypothetical protein